jgi:hypothetical protein
MILTSVEPLGWVCPLTPRSSGRGDDKVPVVRVGVRAAQLNR